MPRHATLLVLLLVGASTGTGCASFRHIGGKDVAKQQAVRTEDTLATFEAQRNEAQFLAAQARWREGNMKACREGLDSLLVRDATHLGARLLLVQVLLSEEKFDTARGYLEQILTERPADARVQHTMGLVLQADGKESEAAEYYRRAAELEPENQEYAQSCAAVASISQERSASFDASIEGLKVPVAQSPADKRAGSPAAGLPGERPEVTEAFRLAEAALAARETSRARDLLTKAASLDPNSPNLPLRAAVLALRHEQPELAIFVLQPVAQRFNDSAALSRTLGVAYYRQRDYQRAQRALEQSLSLDNSSGLAYVLMGCTLEKLNQSEAAKANFERARSLDPRLRLQP